MFSLHTDRERADHSAVLPSVEKSPSTEKAAKDIANEKTATTSSPHKPQEPAGIYRRELEKYVCNSVNKLDRVDAQTDKSKLAVLQRSGETLAVENNVSLEMVRFNSGRSLSNVEVTMEKSLSDVSEPL